MLIDTPIKEISRLGEDERAREQRSYCRVQPKKTERAEEEEEDEGENGMRKDEEQEE